MDNSSACRHPHNARSNSTSYQNCSETDDNKMAGLSCIAVRSHEGFLVMFAGVLSHPEPEASLPLQTGGRRRVILRLTSPGRRKGQGTRTPSRNRVLALGADLLHPPSVLGCFLSRAKIWMRPGLEDLDETGTPLCSKIYWGGLFQTTFLPYRNPAPEECFGGGPQRMPPGLHSWAGG